MISLIELNPGQKAVIQHLRGGRFLFSRLACLGFTPGTTITVIRNWHHGPLLISARGGQVALGRREAAHIIVTPYKDEG